MEAAEILEYLREKEIQVKLVDNNYIDLLPAEKITNELIERLRQYKPAIIAELKREERRKKVLMMLEDNPDSKRAFVTDTESDPDNVILTLAIRNQYSFEMLIPKHKYDPFVALEIIRKNRIH
ncbi:MAG: hypothetical protein KF888_10805 [Nitrosomonas sp.]|nr:hypothetical protein [Nitrosomonas sp.]